MKRDPDERSAIAPIAERQVARWTRGLEAEARANPSLAVARLPEEVRPYVAISREAGAGGGEIGHLVAERLGCECLDNELLTYMAKRYGFREGLLNLVDERVSGWLYDIVRLWIDPRAITIDEYLMRLGQLAILAARQGTTVFVGRGVQFLLPRARGFAVRVIAPLEQRLARTMERRTLGREAAAEYIRQADEGRASLVRRHFHADVADPGLYDLVVNLEHLDRPTAATIITDAFRHRFGSSAP